MICGRIQKLKEGLLPELNVKKLKGYKDQYRLRVGEFRVLFELQPEHTICGRACGESVSYLFW
jgi:mRNA interferase RelE/StbE